MAEDKYFVIGIGGTGMRCMEAFTHLCAVGMFDNKEIDLLSIDTDTNNGNKARSEQLVDRYIRIKGGDAGEPTANTFFSAKLRMFRFSPEYSGDRESFRKIGGLLKGDEGTKAKNRDLADLLFDDDVQDFNLSHGYRAQTHLGSYLMYHGILEAARNVRAGGERVRREDQELMQFINNIYDAGDKARIFIFGSIFGGTGASAIPILPRALADAARVKDPNMKIEGSASFGCSLLTDYFGFNVPDEAQRRVERIIADSNTFARNSQAAMMFYEDDATVQNTYERMYHVGWPDREDFSSDAEGGKTVTGGGMQKNPAHVVEFLCAAAAHHFFSTGGGRERGEMVYRSAFRDGATFAFEWQDFVGQDYWRSMAHRLGTFYAFGHIIQTIDQGVLNTVRHFAEYGTSDYTNIGTEDVQDIDKYIYDFAYRIDGNNVVPGWLFQLRKSVNGPFLLAPEAFADSAKQLRDANFGEFYPDEDHRFATKRLLMGGRPYQEWKETLTKDPSVRPDVGRQKVTRLNERFMAHCFNALTKLYKYS